MIKDKIRQLIFEDSERTSVGILVLCEETNKVLLLKRNVDHHHYILRLEKKLKSYVKKTRVNIR